MWSPTRVAACFLLLIVVLEACHPHHHHHKPTKRACKTKKRSGKQCYYYSHDSKGKSHEHGSSSRDSHEHGHPSGGSHSSSEIPDYSYEEGGAGGGGSLTTCSTGCSGYELQIDLCPIDGTCPDDSKLIVDETKDGCQTLSCKKGYDLGVLGSNKELDISAHELQCHEKSWYSEDLEFGKSVKVLCYKL